MTAADAVLPIQDVTESHLAQMIAALLIVSALGQFVPCVCPISSWFRSRAVSMASKQSQKAYKGNRSGGKPHNEWRTLRLHQSATLGFGPG